MNWPLALVTLMTAELSFGNPLTGFVGALTFHACLIWLLLDEPKTEGSV